MTTDPDPFEEGQRAARENIPAKGNPYRDGSEQHSLWAAGHESIAGEAEANEIRGRLARASTPHQVRGRLSLENALKQRPQPIFVRPFLKRPPLLT
jgi:hypothetical protein